MEERFDAIIIGTGQAGPSLAGRLTQAGQTVAVIERKDLGGTCVNTGCTPTKALVAAAYAARMVRRAQDFGLPGQRFSGVDLAQVMQRKDAIVGQSRTSLEKWIGGMERCKLIRGHARLAGPGTVAVNGDVLHAPRIFLNVGTRPQIASMPGVDKVPFLTNESLLELKALPSHLIVVGGSYVGLEFAQIFRRFGSEVTIVERKPRLLYREDPDVCDAVRGFLEKEGIRIQTGAECIRLERRGDAPVVHLDCQDDLPEIVGSHVLLATGRTPNTNDLGLDTVGISVDAHGYIPVNGRLETSVPGIWALGDCNGRGAFTHTSYNDYEIVAANLLDGETRTADARIPCYAVFTDPPLARVGMNEEQVRQSGRHAMMGTRPMTRVSRAIEKSETEGFMKVLTDAATGEILGASILGTGGDEAIHCIVTAMYARQPASLFLHSVHIHPTVSELIPTVFGELKPLT